jgi:hypothetical protein
LKEPLPIQDSQAQALFCSDQANPESKLTPETQDGTLSYFVLFQKRQLLLDWYANRNFKELIIS